MYDSNQSFLSLIPKNGTVQRHRNDGDANPLLQYFGKIVLEPDNEDTSCTMNCSRRP